MKLTSVVHFLHRSGRTWRNISVHFKKTCSYVCSIWDDGFGFV